MNLTDVSRPNLVKLLTDKLIIGTLLLVFNQSAKSDLGV